MRPTAAVLSTVVAVVLALAGVSLAVAAPAAAAGTAYTWSGLGDGVSWTDPANWSPAGVPGTGDGATVEAASDEVCHAHLTGVPDGLQLADLTVDERLFRGDPDSPCLTSVDGGSVTVTHQFTFHAGTVGTAVTIASGASGVVTPGAAHDTTHLGGAVTVDGGLTLAGTTDAENLSLTGGPGITVAPGGTLTTQGDNHVAADCCLNPAHVTNNGAIRLGAGTLHLDAVELDQNALLATTGGARVLTTFAPQTAGAGARWTGTGSWLLGSSSVTTVTGTQTLSSGFHWLYGGNGSTAEEHLLGTFSLAGNGTFEWDGGVIQAAMTVGSTTRFTADGPDGADHRVLDGRDGTGTAVALTNRGAASFSGGAGWYGTEGGRFTNASTGTLTLGAGTTIGADCCNTPAAIVNAGGRVSVPAGAGTVTVDDTGYRATGGTLDVGAGSDLELTGGASGSLSTTTISGGGTVGIAQPVTTSGTETIAAGTVVALEKSGALTTTGQATTTFAGAGRFSWTGGSVTGTLTVGTGGGQTVSGVDTKQILQPTGARPSVVTLAGPTTVAAGTATSPDTVQIAASSRLATTGTLNLRANTVFTGGTVATSGTTTVAASTGSTTIGANATLMNSGTLTVRTGTLTSGNSVVQTSGATTVVAGAQLAVTGSSSALRINGGTLGGGGQVTGNVVIAAATLAPGGDGGAATFTVTGSLTTATTSTLLLDLGSAGHDQLTIGGAATVRGTLRLTDLAGYQPTAGTQVAVVTAGSLALGLTCTTTSGSTTQYWTAARSGTQLVLTSRVGTSGTC